MRWLLLLSFVVYATWAISSTHGVKPNVLSQYLSESSESFTCLDSSRSIPWTAINDDYCDCPDGSDEPGTSACPSGTFYCRNERHIGVTTFSSRVRDGICDCCDGSDEWDEKDESSASSSSSKCPDTCDIEAEAFRKAEEARISKQREGFEARQKAVEVAANNERILQVTIGELENKIAGLESDLEVLKISEQEAKAKADAERLEREVAEAAAAAENDGTEAAQEVNGAAEGEEEEKEKEVEEQTLNDATTHAEEEHASASAAVTTLEAELNNVRNELRQSQEDLSRQWGVDNFWLSVRKECFRLDTSEYRYEVCPFSKVSQSNLHGGRQTKLGDFESLTDSAMVFSNGERCWGGPDRSAQVVFTCESTNVLISVVEHEKCTYRLTMGTPYACQAVEKLYVSEDGSVNVNV